MAHAVYRNIDEPSRLLGLSFPFEVIAVFGMAFFSFALAAALAGAFFARSKMPRRFVLDAAVWGVRRVRCGGLWSPLTARELGRSSPAALVRR